MDNWYLVYTKVRREEEAAEQLQRQGFGVYLPRLELEKRARGRWGRVIEPLFPRYLFVNVDPTRLSVAPIRSTSGVSHLIRFGTSLCEVPEAIIHYLKGREDRDRRLIIADRPVFNPGDRVEITTGPFAGLTAVFQQTKGSERALVLLEILGSQKTIAFNQNDLVPVSMES